MSSRGCFAVFVMCCGMWRAQGQPQGSSAQCPGAALPCNTSHNPVLYPVSFGVFGAYQGQVFTAGQYLIIVARFAEGTCNLLQPKKAKAPCKPVLTVTLNTTENNYGSCYSVIAARSANEVEANYSVSFSIDPTLRSVVGVDNATYWNHWVFPMSISPGMSSDGVQVLSLYIPPQCDVAGKAMFHHGNLIPLNNTLLTPLVSVDTTQPIIMNLYSTKAPGAYTAGDNIYIVVQFSRDVSFSELPDPFSAVIAPEPPVAANRSGRPQSDKRPECGCPVLTGHDHPPAGPRRG